MKHQRTAAILLLVSLVLMSCGPQAEPTEPLSAATPVVITKVVEKIETTVVKEVEEKVVTATPEPVETSKAGGTLVVGTGGLVQFDPVYVTDDTSMHVISNVFSMLFRRSDRGPIPDLATSWEYENDTTVIFHLRRGVMFHEDNAVFPKGQSREVVADDVVYSLKRAIETEGNTTPSDLFNAYESAEALDDYTVKLTMKYPDGLLFVGTSGLNHLGIVPREAVEQLGEDFALNPIGSGPFKFQSYRPDETLTLVRNDLYYQEPYLDGVVFRVIPDREVQIVALETGEIDALAAAIPSSAFERMLGDSRFVLHSTNCPVGTQMFFNVNHPLFADQRFRQAIAYALDAQAINENVWGRMAISGCGTAGPGIPGHDPQLCDKYFGYKPEEAKAILNELGWSDSDGDGILDKEGEPLTFELEIWTLPPMPQFGAAIVTQLKELGIDVQLQTVEFGTWVDDRNQGLLKAWTTQGWCSDGATNLLWGESSSMHKFMGYDDPVLYALLDESNTTVDSSERERLLREVTNRIYSQYWAIPFGWFDDHNASRSWARDYYGPRWHMNLCTEINNVWLDREK